jgi:hypothetical protein
MGSDWRTGMARSSSTSAPHPSGRGAERKSAVPDVDGQDEDRENDREEQSWLDHEPHHGNDPDAHHETDPVHDATKPRVELHA